MPTRGQRGGRDGEEGVIDADRDLFWYADTAHEIWDGILRWYEAAGRPLLAPG